MKKHTALDEHYMNLALEQARKAYSMNEVPIGALLVYKNHVFESHNEVITRSDPTAHAEILVIRKACEAIKNYRLPDASIYITVEPCAMCVGAILQTRIKHIIFGTYEYKTGCTHSTVNLLDTSFNHQTSVTAEVLGKKCSEILSHFFQTKRKKTAQSSDEKSI